MQSNSGTGFISSRQVPRHCHCNSPNSPLMISGLEPLSSPNSCQLSHIMPWPVCMSSQYQTPCLSQTDESTSMLCLSFICLLSLPLMHQCALSHTLTPTLVPLLGAHGILVLLSMSSHPWTSPSMPCKPKRECVMSNPLAL